jgi:type IV secretion system protein VirB10
MAKTEKEKEENGDAPEDGQKFELSPEDATSLGGGSGPGMFNRKRLLVALCAAFSVIICGGLILNSVQSSKKKAAERGLSAGSSSNNSEFLTSLQNRALYNSRRDSASEPAAPAREQEEEPEPLLPAVSFNRMPEAAAPAPAQPAPTVPQPQAYPQPQQEPAHFKSPLVPQIQGSLFSQAFQPQNAQTQQPYAPPAVPGYAAQGAYGGQASEYAAQNAQDNKQAFYDSSAGGEIFNGRYLGGNSLWTGTVIPAVLETAVSTDLPGNVLARVSQNVFDSLTGKNLLVPQGTLLVARYNSSVSYAQSRVQIVWDTLIRPDGYFMELEGANGVDRTGMSGQEAVRHENWFEYLKAAGIITVFTIVNSSLTAAAAKDAPDDAAANIALANSQTVNQLGGNIISRAMNIQPTLTVENGTRVNVMLNKTIYLPPLEAYRAPQKY